MMTNSSKKKRKKRKHSSSDHPTEEEKPLRAKKKGKRKRKSSSMDIPEMDEPTDSSVTPTLGTKKRKKKVKGRKHAKVDAGPSLEKVARRKAKKKKTNSKRESASLADSLRVTEPVAEIEDEQPTKKRRKVSKKRRQTKVDSSRGESSETTLADDSSSHSPESSAPSSSSLPADSHMTTSQDDVEDPTKSRMESSNELMEEQFEIDSQTVDSSDQSNIACDDHLPDSTKDSIASEGNESTNTVPDVSADIENPIQDDDAATSHDSEQSDLKDKEDANENENEAEITLTDQAECTEFFDNNAEDLLQNEETNEDGVSSNTVDTEASETASTSSSVNISSEENVADETKDVENSHDTAESSAGVSESPENDREMDNDSNGNGEEDDTTNAASVPADDLLVSKGENPTPLDPLEIEGDDSNKKESIDEPEDIESLVEDIKNEVAEVENDNEEEQERESTEESDPSAIDDQLPGSTEDESDQLVDAESSTVAESITVSDVEKSAPDENDSGEIDGLAKIENIEGDEKIVAEPKDEVEDDDNDDDDDLDGEKLQSEPADTSKAEEELILTESTEKEETTISSSDSQSKLIADRDASVNEDTISIEMIETFCDDPSDLTCSIITWNLAEESPEEDEAAFLKQFRGHDIVLISGQECENIKPRRTEGRRSREYRRLMIKYLGSEYVPIALHMLGGIQFGLFCKRSILKDVELVSVADVTCGIGNVFHNKGAIAAFVTLQNKSPAQSLRLLFVTAHMAAHVKNTEARNADFWRIVSELEEQVPAQFLAPRSSSMECTGEYLLDSVDRIFFCGDLNYRIDLPREIVEHTIRKAKQHGSLDSEALQKLLRHDQLRAVMAEGLAFPGFAEGKISFDPTFKYDKGTQDFDTSPKQRIPAWTDRVLFKPKGTRVLTYDSVPLATHSDHRPVFASFRVNRKAESKPKRRKRKR